VGKRSKVCAIHWKYIYILTEGGNSLWLSKGNLKIKTESVIITAQGKALHNKYHANKIWKQKPVENADHVHNMKRP
jgi:hypothetical protein